MGWFTGRKSCAELEEELERRLADLENLAKQATCKHVADLQVLWTRWANPMTWYVTCTWCKGYIPNDVASKLIQERLICPTLKP